MSDRLIEVIRGLFTYEPITGVVTRKVATSNRVHVGDIVGTVKRTHVGKPYERAYLQVRVEGRCMLLHVVIFALVTGRFPAPGMQIDHKNGDGLCNAWENLREATKGQNMMNRGANREKRSALPKGVFWHARDRLYVAKLAGRTVGTSKSIRAAKAAYDKAARAGYGEFATG